MTILLKRNSMAKGRRRDSVIFLVGKKNPPIFCIALAFYKSYLRQTGNTAQSRQSLWTAGKFPESRSAKSKARVRWLTKARDSEGRAGGDCTYQGRVQDGAPDKP